MFARVVKALALASSVLIAVIAFLYATGVPIGNPGGVPEAERRVVRDRQAREVEKHRQAQRATSEPSLASRPQSNDVVQSSTAAPIRSGSAAAVAAPYWTGFRGPRRDGEYRERPILTNWPAAGLQPLWKQPIGGGHASFVIAEQRAFTVEQRGNDEVAAAYDISTGRELWTVAWPAAFGEAYGGDGPRATPVWHDGTVFVLGAGGELRALDAANGGVRWRTNILEDAGASNLEYGNVRLPARRR